MSSTPESYNGWRNVETWRVQLHLTSDEKETFVALNGARWCIGSPLFENVCGDPVDPSPADAAVGMAEYLRDYVTHNLETDDPIPVNTWGMFSSDVVDAALARVDWGQIAAHWLDAARHELAKGAAT